MGLSKNRSRVITVDDVQYRWTMSYPNPPKKAIELIVQLNSGSGQRLVVEFGDGYDDSARSPYVENYDNAPGYYPFTPPWGVQQIILKVLKLGWNSCSKGQIRFRLEGDQLICWEQWLQKPDFLSWEQWVRKPQNISAKQWARILQNVDSS